MKKTYSLVLVLTGIMEAANASAMVYMEPGTCGGASAGIDSLMMFFAGLMFFAAASFIFSLIFWLTYRWIGKK